MKKKESLLVALMGLVTVAVIFMGFTYNKNRKEELLNSNQYEVQSQSDSFNERKNKAEEKKKAEFLDAFEKNRRENTVADFLQYVAYHKENKAVAFYGDVKNGAPWADKALDALAREQKLEKMKKHFIAAENLVDEDKLVQLENSQADIIFLAAPAEKETEEIFQTYDEIKAASPDALVVLLAPLANLTEEAELEESGLAQVAAGYKVPFFNLNESFLKKAAETKQELKNFYKEGTSELNEAGLQLLQEVFLANLRETKVDTSTAFHAKGKKAAAESVVKESIVEESSSEEPEAVEESFEEVPEPEEEEPIWSEEEKEESIWEESEYENPGSNWTPPVTTPPSTPAPKPNPPANKPSGESGKPNNGSGTGSNKPVDPPKVENLPSKPETDSSGGNQDSSNGTNIDSEKDSSSSQQEPDYAEKDSSGNLIVE